MHDAPNKLDAPDWLGCSYRPALVEGYRFQLTAVLTKVVSPSDSRWLFRLSKYGDQA
ncbi:hypothetical protein [Pseudarthrobacter sp. N5]|uniref:hypothetical protein n=1 Tax=Pseudarthrobacter sp. N5 TaxID=3418416 RepID=UPI003CEA7B51